MPKTLGSTKKTRRVWTISCNYKNENHIKRRCQKLTEGNRFRKVWCSNSWWIIIKITWSRRIKTSKILRTLYRASGITTYLSKLRLVDLKRTRGVLYHISTSKAHNNQSPSQLFKTRLTLSLRNKNNIFEIIPMWLWISNYTRHSFNRCKLNNNRWSLHQAETVHRASFSKKPRPRVMPCKKSTMGGPVTVSQFNKLKLCPHRWILDTRWNIIKTRWWCNNLQCHRTNKYPCASLLVMSSR